MSTTHGKWVVLIADFLVAALISGAQKLKPRTNPTPVLELVAAGPLKCAQILHDYFPVPVQLYDLLMRAAFVWMKDA